MRSFRSKPVGWRYESNRHSLAAKGVSTRYFAKDAKAKYGDFTLASNSEYERGQDAIRELGKYEKNKNDVKYSGGKDRTTLAKGRPTLTAEESLVRKSTYEIMARRPINQALSLVEAGRFDSEVPIYDGESDKVTNYVRIDELGKYLKPAEREALRAAIVSAGVNVIGSGRYKNVDALPKYVQREIERGRGKSYWEQLKAKATGAKELFTKEGLKKEADLLKGKLSNLGRGKTEAEKEIAKKEKEQALLNEAPWRSELRAYGREKVVGAVEGIVEGIEDAPGRVGDFLGSVYTEKPEFRLGADQEFPGVGERIDKFDKSALFQTNAAIGNEEDGSFKFMNNEPKIQAKLEGREPSREQFGSVGGFFDNLTGLETGRPDSYAKKVENEVNSLFQAKHNLADVDLTPFNKGTKAFKEGKREEVVKAVADLESEERKVKDRYTLVQKTWQKMLTENNQDSLFKDSRDSWSVLGADGGKKLADETEKLNDVKASLTKSASMVADRKYILKNRLGRMDANVPLETGAPQGRQITVVEDSNKKDVVTSLQKPGQVIEEVFEGRLS